MSQGDIIEISKAAIQTTLMIAAPFLIASLVIGLVISIFMAATQIQEMTLTFVPKILATFVILLVLAPWLMNIMIDFTTEIFGLIPELN